MTATVTWDFEDRPLLTHDNILSELRQAWDLLRRDRNRAKLYLELHERDAEGLTPSSTAAEVSESVDRYARMRQIMLQDVHAAPSAAAIRNVKVERVPGYALANPSMEAWDFLLKKAEEVLPVGDDLRGVIFRWRDEWEKFLATDQAKAFVAGTLNDGWANLDIADMQKRHGILQAFSLGQLRRAETVVVTVPSPSSSGLGGVAAKVATGVFVAGLVVAGVWVLWRTK